MAEEHAAIAAALNRVLELCRSSPEGVGENAVVDGMKNVPVEIRAKAINILLQKGQLQLFNKDGQLFYKEQSREEATKLKGLQTEDLLVYQAIQAAKNDGIWTKEIRLATSLQQPQITKALKNLEGRKLIKPVPSTQKGKKVYILAELEPSAKLTGGSFYRNQEFDAEFVNLLKQQCHQFISRQIGGANVEQVANFIRKSGISNDLSLKDIKQVLDMLVLDGEVDEAGNGVYRVSQTRMSGMSAFTDVPCGVCPVIHDCSPNGIISPNTCAYYQQWLKF